VNILPQDNNVKVDDSLHIIQMIDNIWVKHQEVQKRNLLVSV